MGKKKRVKRGAARRRRAPPRKQVPAESVALPTWKKLLFSVLATGLFFAAVELLLAAAGVQPVLYEDDPYVGFSSLVPHFVESPAGAGPAVMETANNKLRLFNRQSFARDKGDATRVFCLGGSTTYGRPYGDVTSFCGWLRELLPAADPSRRFEVVNAGGISYASYRVAALMEELLEYQPDIFVVYTGHNEFLEQRTYGRIIAYPDAVRGLGALASRTRLFTAAGRALASLGRPAGEAPAQTAVVLDDEVRTLLDASVGPDAYSRDEALQARVIEHYRYSLARMADMARAAGAALVLVSPASNLRHCSPFKSEPVAGLDDAGRRRWEGLFETAQQAAGEGRWRDVLAALEEASAIDDRHAGAHYLRGRALDGSGRYDQAKAAFERARDEDVCPLRALGTMHEIVAEVARTRDLPLVDFVALVEDRSQHGIPGEDLFLDHVHPTIEGNRLLALEILDTLEREGLVRPSPAWGPDALQAVIEKVESRLDPAAHGLALSNLSKVLGWAGKLEEARKLAIRSAQLAPESAEVNHQAALAAHLTGHLDDAERHYRKTLELAPQVATAHSNLAVILDESGRDREAAVHYAQAIALLDDKNAAYRERLQEALEKL